MATSMEADSEVHFKERQEGKGVKTETAVDDATLQFEFRASTPAASPSGRGAEHRGGDGEEPRRIELKKFSLRPEKYDGKVDFEGWVNQFEEYATLGQWTEEEKSSLLFLSLTAGACMYFVGLPEREKMAYVTRVEALRRRFGQETDTSIALQELAGLRKESVRQGTSRQCEAVGQPGLSFQRLRQPGESGAPRVPDGRR